MKIDKYNNSKHLIHLKDWFSKRNQSFYPEELAEIGFIAFHDENPIAAAFLRRSEGSFGIFDGLVTDPEANANVRDQALDLITKAIIDQAKELKLKGIMAWSQDYFTLLRAYRHGFKQLPETVIALDLSLGDQSV